MHIYRHFISKQNIQNCRFFTAKWYIKMGAPPADDTEYKSFHDLSNLTVVLTSHKNSPGTVLSNVFFFKYIIIIYELINVQYCVDNLFYYLIGSPRRVQRSFTVWLDRYCINWVSCRMDDMLLVRKRGNCQPSRFTEHPSTPPDGDWNCFFLLLTRVYIYNRYSGMLWWPSISPVIPFSL